MLMYDLTWIKTANSDRMVTKTRVKMGTRSAWGCYTDPHFDTARVIKYSNGDY